MSTDTAVTGYSPQSSDDTLAPGTIVENFRIECTLGRGGMSTVYGAVHTVIGKRGAIKVLRRELCTDEKEVERFVQEARAVNQIGHANIVDVFAFGTLPDGRSYLIMEWLVGQSLRNRMRRGQLSRNEVRAVTLDVVRALEATHAKGIIHRDLKPDNVFLVEAPGEKPRAKLLDFGVAKLTGEGRHDRTRIGSMLGTPQYLAPEQARGEPVIASDIYTLGVMIFELCAGRPPFVGEGALDVVAMHMTEPPPKLSSLVAGVTPELDALLDAMLAKDPADRPSLFRIRGEFEQLGATPKPPVTGMRTISTRARTTKLALLIAGLAGALAMVLVFFFIVSAKSEPIEHVEKAERPVKVEKPEKPEKPEKLDKKVIARQAAPPEQPAPPKPAQALVAPEVPRKGALKIEWAGREKLTFSLDGKPVEANQALDLEPGTYKLDVHRKNKTETQDVVITAGNTTMAPIKATTRARSKPTDNSLDPRNDALR